MLPTCKPSSSSLRCGSPSSRLPTFVQYTDVLRKPLDKFVARIRAFITFASERRPRAIASNKPAKKKFSVSYNALHHPIPFSPRLRQEQSFETQYGAINKENFGILLRKKLRYTWELTFSSTISCCFKSIDFFCCFCFKNENYWVNF